MKKAGWIMTALLLAFLLPASVAPKLMGAQVAVDALVAIDWPTGYLLALGVFLWVALYLRDPALRSFVRSYFTAR